MTTPHLLTAIALATCAGTAISQDAKLDVWASFDHVALPAPRSRAEVLAELEIYRRSGLAELERGEVSRVFTQRHRLASARFAAMHASPEFMSLVQGIAQSRGERVDVAHRPAPDQ